VTMDPTLGWPTVAVLGFLMLTGLVIALGTTSTARYEFERNGARERSESSASASRNHPAGRRSVGGADAAQAQGQPQAVDLAVRPEPAPAARVSGWWLVDGAADVVAGPYADRIDADWAALADELPAVAVFGTARADGGVAMRPSPDELSWLGELGNQLDRLPEDWDELLSDTDPLTTLVVEVAAALVETGLPLHDAGGDGSEVGGVCLLPQAGLDGIVVAWRQHDRMSVDQVHGPAADAMVHQVMNSAVAEVLRLRGFQVDAFGGASGHVVRSAA
jgi:hypothetical protein